jgi:hypothetical protein
MTKDTYVLESHFISDYSYFKWWLGVILIIATAVVHMAARKSGAAV